MNLPVLSAGGGPIDVQHSFVADEETRAGLSPNQILAIVWAYRKVTMAIFLSAAVLSAVGIKMLPKTYAATATLMMNTDIRDPLAGKDISGSLQAGYLATEMQLMTSPEVLLPVIETLNLTANKDYTAGFNSNTVGANLPDYVRQGLVKDLDIEQGAQGSLLMNITASSRDPVLAAAIANAIADVYTREQKQRVENPATDRTKRYAEELSELQQKVSIAQDQVAAFRQRTGVIDLSAQRSVESEVLNSLEHRLDDAQNQRRTAEIKGADDPGAGAGAVQSLKSEMDAEQTKLAQLKSTLGEHHPKVLELEAQIEATRRALAGNTSSSRTSAREYEQKLQAAIEVQRAKVLAVRELQDEGNKYVLELDSAQSVYKKALDGYDSIMFASAGHYNYVNLVSRAIVPPESTKPKKGKLFFVALLASLGLGFGAPLCYELFLKRRVRVVEDLERSLGVNVLAEFQAIRLSSEPA